MQLLLLGKRSNGISPKTFISIFWTERIGPSAALASLKVMEKIKSWEIITEIGLKIQKGWAALAKSNNLDIKIYGLPLLLVILLIILIL